MYLPHSNPLVEFVVNRVNQCLCIVITVLTLTGCSVTENPRFVHLKKTDLYQWIDKELLPYLSDELARQPRFKGESIMLVTGQELNSIKGTDQLTAEVRERLMDGLLSSNGIDLVRYAGISENVSTRLQSGLDCHRSESVDYQITIEFDIADKKHARLRILALETKTGKWVSGFGRSWQGRLDQNQIAMLNTQVVKDKRGYRETPFTLGESDLLAAYLADKIRCARADLQLSSKIEISTGKAATPAVTKILELIARYLGSSGAQTKLLPVVESELDATLQLSGSLVRVSGDLHQLWVQMKSKSNKRAITKLNVNTYVSMHPDAVALNEVAPAKKVEELDAINSQTELLSHLKIKADGKSRACDIEPSGRQRLRSFPETAKCISLEFKLYKAATVALIRHQVNGRLSRVPVEGCNVTSAIDMRKTPASDIRVAGLRLRKSAWVTSESLYAIAITDGQLARKVLTHVALLPNDCDQPEPAQSVDSELAWLARLDQIVDQYQNVMEWKTVHVSL